MKQPKFDYIVHKIELAQDQTEVLTKTDEFPPFTLTDKEIKRIKKRGKKTGAFARS